MAADPCPSIQRAANHALAGHDFAGRPSHCRADALGADPDLGEGHEGGFSTFNARADGIDTKLTFKGAWKAGRRCLILAGGFFEWRKAGVADKQPFAFAMGNHEIMTMTGLWEAWKNPEDGQ